MLLLGRIRIVENFAAGVGDEVFEFLVVVDHVCVEHIGPEVGAGSAAGVGVGFCFDVEIVVVAAVRDDIQTLAAGMVSDIFEDFDVDAVRGGEGAEVFDDFVWVVGVWLAVERVVDSAVDATHIFYLRYY